MLLIAILLDKAAMGAVFIWVKVLWAAVMSKTLVFRFSSSFGGNGSSSFPKVDLHRLICMGLRFSGGSTGAALA